MFFFCCFKMLFFAFLFVLSLVFVFFGFVFCFYSFYWCFVLFSWFLLGVVMVFVMGVSYIKRGDIYELYASCWKEHISFSL